MVSRIVGSTLKLLGMLTIVTGLGVLVLAPATPTQSGLELLMEDPGALLRALRAAVQDPQGLLFSLRDELARRSDGELVDLLAPYTSPRSGGIPISGIVPEEGQAFPAAPSAPRLDLPPPARLRIPAIGVDSAVVPVGGRRVEIDGRAWTVWQTADEEVGHHQGSADPGEAGNLVLSGHNNLYTEIFRRLGDLEAGDRLLVQSETGEEWVYVVEQVLIVPEEGMPPQVRAQNGRWLLPTEVPVATLVSCWPYWTNSHRVIVRARMQGQASDEAL